MSSSSFPPSTLPISALSDLIHSSTPSLSSKSSFSSVSTLPESANMAGVQSATTPGLDLLGILAEEVDWDPQQRGAPNPAQLALVGKTLQKNQEKKQQQWAGQILGSLGLIDADGTKRNSFSSLTAAFVPSQNSVQEKRKARQSVPVDPLNTMTLTKRTALFYENLYEQLCPGIVPRAYIYPKLGRKLHEEDASFAGLALSVSLLGLLGLTLPKESSSNFIMPSIPLERRTKAQATGELRMEATRLIHKVLSLRLSSPSGGIGFGQAPTTETVLISFFLSIALCNLDDEGHERGMESGEQWKDAAFFRFCEAITLAKIMGLDRAEEEEQKKMRELLSRAERWWAQQKIGYVCQLSTQGGGRKRSRSSDQDLCPASNAKRSRTEPLSLLARLGFGGVRDDLCYRFRDLVPCWTGRCDAASCRMLTASAVVQVHDSLAGLSVPHSDPILVDLARQALRAILWASSLHHSLISPSSPGPLRPDQPLHIALDTLDLLEDLDQLARRSDTEDAVKDALVQIRECVAKLPNGRWGEEKFSFEHVEGSSESEGSAEEDERNKAESTTTTVSRAAQSIMENLDRFLYRDV